MKITFSKYPFFWRVLLFTFVFVPCGFCEEVKSEPVGVKIIEYGIYDAQYGQVSLLPDNWGDHKREATECYLIESTTQIPARLRSSFGVTFKGVGNPSGGGLVCRIKLIHPPIRNPKTGEMMEFTEWPLIFRVGGWTHACWSFDYPWELVAGKWTFQITYKGIVMAEKEFSVKIP